MTRAKGKAVKKEQQSARNSTKLALALQTFEAATMRQAICKSIFEQMDATGKFGDITLHIAEDQFVYLRDLLGNQWGREQDNIDVARKTLGLSVPSEEEDEEEDGVNRCRFCDAEVKEGDDHYIGSGCINELSGKYYIVAGEDEGETNIVKANEQPATFLQGPFATLEEAQDADWDATVVIN